jgi:hypothetical protein
MKIRRVLLFLTLFSVMALAVMALAGGGVGAAQPDIPHGIYRGVSTAVKFDISPPLRDLAPAEFTPPAAEIPERATGLEGPLGPQDVDPLVQTAVGSGLIPGPIISFNGPPNISNVSPPDPVGDVGPNHYVAMSNLSFQIFDKAGNSLYGPAFNNTLWAGFGGDCQTDNSGDPIVLHDQIADRWMLSQFTASGPTYFNCVAVSQTPDPTGPYYRWAFSTGTNFPDYPKYGFWPDALYISTREFAGATFAGVGAYAVKRSDLISGNPAAQVISFLVTPASAGGAYNIGDGLLPSDLDGSTPPPAASPNYYMGSMDNGGPYGAPQDALTLWKFTADFVTPGNSTFLLANTIPIAAYDTIFPCSPGTRNCIPQPGTTNKVDILSYRQRPMHRLAYRNFGTHESLVTNQSVEAAPSMAGIRWWEVRSPNSAPVLYQEGTYAPGTTDGVHRWMGSIAMDQYGNMALGYSASDATVTFPSSWYTGRLAGDPLGTMPQGEASMINGTGSQTGSARWGDYTSMNVDPVDDCTFWYVNQWIPVTSSVGWQLRIGAFQMPGCGGGVPLTCNGPVAGFEDGAFPPGWSFTTLALPGGEWVVSMDNSSAFWDPGPAPEGVFYASANDDLPGSGSDGSADFLYTNILDLSGYATASLDFWYHFNGAFGHAAGGVDVSGDGGTTWDGELILPTGPVWQQYSLNLDAYAGNDNVQVRFHSNDGGFWAAGYGIDGVSLTCVGPNIDVNPLSLSSSQPSNTTVVQTLSIDNTGNEPLNWSIFEEPAVLPPMANRPGYAPGARAQDYGPSGSAAPQPAAAPLGDWRWPSAVLYDNGPIINSPGTGPGGADESIARDVTVGLVSRGFNHSVSGNFRVADDFTVPAGGWDIGNITFVPYMGASPPLSPSPISGVNLRIWDGSPDDAGSTVVFGDTTTNRLVSTEFANIYRRLESEPADASRRVFVAVASVNTFLPAGTYWLDWQVDGDIAYSGPWAPPVTIDGQTSTGNALQWTGTLWQAVIDTGLSTPLGLPFIIESSLCANPADIPWASVNPAGGTTAPGGSTSVDVTFDSTGLYAGSYSGNLCVTSDDPDPGPGNGTDLVVVPLELAVEADPAIELVKTVGTAAGVCATTDSITVDPGTTVYYCYEVTNTGNITLTLHDLADDQLGTIFTGLNYALAPGASVNTVDAGLSIPAVINVTTTNIGTWTAYNPGPADTATANASATVTVENFYMFLPMIFRDGGGPAAPPAAVLPAAIPLLLGGLFAGGLFLGRKR